MRPPKERRQFFWTKLNTLQHSGKKDSMKCAPFRNKLFRFREVILIFHQSVSIDQDATSGGNGDAFDGARFVALPPKPSEKSGQNKSTQ